MHPEFVWLNDDLLPVGEARVSVLDRGFLYGDGLFETLRVEGGRPQFLQEHLARLKTSCQAFRLPFPEGLPWEERIARLLTVSRLTAGEASLKILISRGAAPELGLPRVTHPTLVIYARAYQAPAAAEYAAGWPVGTFPESRSTFIGRHKSLNYLFYLAARQHALDRGAKEAVILEADGNVSEGAATSLVYFQGGSYYAPQSRSALPGVTQAVLARALARRQERLEWVPTSPSRLREAEAVWLVNSLMGLMPVSALDGAEIPVSPGTTKYLQECLAAEAKREGG